MSKDCRKKNNARYAIGDRIRQWPRFLLALLASSSAFGSIVQSNSSTITGITSYTQFGSGDVTFTLSSSGLTGCSGGFWIRPTDGGASNVIAQVLEAQITGKTVVVYADNTVIWSGGPQACLVWAVSS